MDFSMLTRDPRQVQAPPGSTNAELLALPQIRKYTHDVQGLVMMLPRTGLVVVPFKMHRGGWDVVVVRGYGPYSRGGHHLYVSDLELQTGEVVFD